MRSTRCVPHCRPAQEQGVCNHVIPSPGSQRSQCSMAQLWPALERHAVASEHASCDYAHHLAWRNKGPARIPAWNMIIFTTQCLHQDTTDVRGARVCGPDILTLNPTWQRDDAAAGFAPHTVQISTKQIRPDGFTAAWTLRSGQRSSTWRARGRPNPSLSSMSACPCVAGVPFCVALVAATPACLHV